jgi:hypothetical protein
VVHTHSQFTCTQKMVPVCRTVIGADQRKFLVGVRTSMANAMQLVKKTLVTQIIQLLKNRAVDLDPEDP